MKNNGGGKFLSELIKEMEIGTKFTKNEVTDIGNEGKTMRR